MCCSQTWVNGHLTDISIHPSINSIPIHTWKPTLTSPRHAICESFQVATLAPPNWRPPNAGVSRQLQSAIHRSSVSGVFWTESFRLNSWLRGFLMYLVYFGCEKTWWKLSNPTLYLTCLNDSYSQIRRSCWRIPCKLNSKTSGSTSLVLLYFNTIGSPSERL